MSTRGTIKQYLLILEAIQHRKSSAADLMSRLKGEGFELSKRTLQGRLEELRTEFDIEVSYQTEGNFYHIEDEKALYAVNNLIRLFESTQLSDFLNSLVTENSKDLRYISVQTSSTMKGIQLLPVLFDAIRQNQIISFDHENYNTGTKKTYRVMPYMLKEYLYRWYLVSVAVGKTEPFIFGIDRIKNLLVTQEPFSTDPLFPYDRLFDHVIGLNYSNALVEKIVLLLDPKQAKYLESFPLHPSQKVISATVKAVTIQLEVIINYELIQQILQWGVKAEVISPKALRDKVASLLTTMQKKYD